MDLDICPTLISNRKDYFRAQARGQSVQEFNPSGRADWEIEELYKFIKARLLNEGKEA